MSYIDLLDQVHRSFRPRTYLEIGVSRGDSVRLVLDGTRAIGVDPHPAIVHPLSAETTVESMTSDQFFAGHAESAFGVSGIDMAFIDGMHLFEYALRDLLNIERFATTDTVVFLDDCLPGDESTTARDRSTILWTGDVWKVLPYLREQRPELTVVATTAAPTGLVAVAGFSGVSRNISIEEDIAQAVQDYGCLTYEDFCAFRDSSVQLHEPTIAGLDAVLPSEPWQDTSQVPSLVAARGARRRGVATLARSIRKSKALAGLRKRASPTLAHLRSRRG